MWEGAGSRAADLVSDHHGVLTSGPIWQGGAFGTAIEFDGTNDHLIVSNQPDLDLVSTGTIFVWFLITGNSADNAFPRLISKGNSGATDGSYSLFVRDDGSTPNTMRARWIDSGGTAHDAVESTVLYTDDLWHCAVGVKGESYISLWMDGVLRQEVGDTFSTKIVSDAVRIGDGDGNRHLNGKIGMCGVYNRALDPDEIVSLYADPFAMLRPQSISRRFVEEAPAPGGIVVLRRRMEAA